MIGTSTTFWIDFKRPRVGVVPPPTPRFAHTSILSAPPLTALKKGFRKLEPELRKDRASTPTRWQTVQSRRRLQSASSPVSSEMKGDNQIHVKVEEKADMIM